MNIYDLPREAFRSYAYYESKARLCEKAQLLASPAFASIWYTKARALREKASKMTLGETKGEI
jgi:hypothetical protein